MEDAETDTLSHFEMPKSKCLGPLQRLTLNSSPLLLFKRELEAAQRCRVRWRMVAALFSFKHGAKHAQGPRLEKTRRNNRSELHLLPPSLSPNTPQHEGGQSRPQELPLHLSLSFPWSGELEGQYLYLRRSQRRLDSRCTLLSLSLCPSCSSSSPRPQHLPFQPFDTRGRVMHLSKLAVEWSKRTKLSIRDRSISCSSSASRVQLVRASGPTVSCPQTERERRRDVRTDTQGLSCRCFSSELSHTHTHTPIYTHASTHWFVQPFIYSFDYSSFLLYFSLNNLYILFHAWTKNLCFSVNAGQKHRMYWQFASNSLSSLMLILMLILIFPGLVQSLRTG